MILACLFVAVLLVIGFALRNRFGIFDKIYIPASVIAGTIGLAVIQLLPFFSLPESADRILGEAVAVLAKWPAFLIAVVFAAMLLQRHSGRHRLGMRATVCEAIMVWIIALGQTAIGLLLTWLVIQPFYDVPNAFGMLIETGFAGGHGTAAAMGQIFITPQIDFPVGRDLGLLMATVGLVYGTISGIFWINLVLRLKLAVVDQAATTSRDGESIAKVDSIANETKLDNAGPRSIESQYMIQIMAIAAAFAIGFFCARCRWKDRREA